MSESDAKSSDVSDAVVPDIAEHETTQETRPLFQMEYLILDSNAFIRGYGLSNLCKKAHRIVTIEEVLDEIRDSKAKETLLNLPFELETRNPTPQAVKEVADFAMKTGDFHSLSKTDLKLIALSKTLEVELAPAKKEAEVSEATPPAPVMAQEVEKPAAQPQPPKPPAEEAPRAVSGKGKEKEMGKVKSDRSAIPTKNAGDLRSVILSSSNQYVESESKYLQENDDGLGWINADNFHDPDAGFITVASHRNKGGKKKNARPVEKTPAAPENCPVGLFTTDFTMQNLMLQMGLHVISADGMLVRSIRKWVLRCMACFTVHTKDMNRLFCSRCGSDYVARISASVDEGGKLKLHFKKNYPLDNRGKIYSLPAPGKQDRFQGELLLREDQLLSGIWRQKVVKINKDIKSAFGEDVTSDVGLHLNKQEKIVIGLGKSNPNARKGRERRGKKAR